MFKRALVSVSDKTGLAEFLKPLVDQGMAIVSSGGTGRYLEDQGFTVTSVSNQTEFPEVMGGRVKTLHPRIHMPILQRGTSEDKKLLEDHKLDPFDLVIVNLYPFAEGLKKQRSFHEMVELIDIGGPTLLRAAAKNFKNLTVVCDPSDYSWLNQKNEVTLEDRQKLSAKVFRMTTHYDQMIAQYLDNPTQPEAQESHPRWEPSYKISGTLNKVLRYGENPQQQGAWFSTSEEGLHSAKILQGKELSYNNLLDIESACQTLSLFSKPTVISVKHNNPCGVASHDSFQDALVNSVSADPVSVFGGIVAANRTLDEQAAEYLCSKFIECVVAPEITEKAKIIFKNKKNLRVLCWPQLKNGSNMKASFDFKSVLGGFLVQDRDGVNIDTSQWEFCGDSPSEEFIEELKFTWKVCASLKSNAIAICSQFQSRGLGMGQVNRVDAVEQALERGKKFHPESKNWILGSDAFFPFPDSIERAASAGVQWVIQPGGSIRDKEVRARAKELEVNMVLTGQRHFKH